MIMYIFMEWTQDREKVTAAITETHIPGIPWEIPKSLSNSKLMEALREADSKFYYDVSNLLFLQYLEIK